MSLAPALSHSKLRTAWERRSCRRTALMYADFFGTVSEINRYAAAGLAGNDVESIFGHVYEKGGGRGLKIPAHLHPSITATGNLLSGNVHCIFKYRIHYKGYAERLFRYRVPRPATRHAPAPCTWDSKRAEWLNDRRLQVRPGGSNRDRGGPVVGRLGDRRQRQRQRQHCRRRQ